jgi:hypothetical protein
VGNTYWLNIILM